MRLADSYGDALGDLKPAIQSILVTPPGRNCLLAHFGTLSKVLESVFAV